MSKPNISIRYTKNVAIAIFVILCFDIAIYASEAFVEWELPYIPALRLRFIAIFELWGALLIALPMSLKSNTEQCEEVDCE